MAGRLTEHVYFGGLLALVFASTLNGLTIDVALVGREITVRPDQVIAVLIGSAMAAGVLTGRFRIKLSLLDWVVLGFLLCNIAASVLFSPRRSASLQACALLTMNAAMYFGVRQLLVRRPDWIAPATNGLVVAGILQVLYAVLALLLYARGWSIGGLHVGHVTQSSVALKGTFWEANLFGAFLAVVAAYLAIRYLWHRTPSHGWLFLAGLFTVVVALPMTLTRAAGLAFGVVLAGTTVVSWVCRREIGHWGRKVLATGATLTAAMLLTFTLMNSVISDLSKLPDFLVQRWVPASWKPVEPPASMSVETPPVSGRAAPAPRTVAGAAPIPPSPSKAEAEVPAVTADSRVVFASRSSTEGRLEVWRQALDAWSDRPILGHGTLGGAAIVKEGWWYSSLIQALYDTGLAGFAALGAIYAIAVLSPFAAWLRQRRNPTAAILLGLAAGNAVLALTSQFSSFLFVGFPWVFLGLTMGAADARLSESSRQ